MVRAYEVCPQEIPVTKSVAIQEETGTEILVSKVLSMLPVGNYLMLSKLMVSLPSVWALSDSSEEFSF